MSAATATQPPALKKGTYAWAIVLACIGFYAIPIGVVANTSGVFLTPVMEQFGWDRTTASLYMTIMPLVAAACTPFSGMIFRRFSPRIVLTITGLAYGLATIWTAYATEPWVWHLYGVIYGICASFFMYLAVPTLINAWFKKNAGLAIGITSALLSIIAAFCSPWAQAMINTTGWQSARLTFGIIITVVPVALVLLFVRRQPSDLGMLPWGAEEAKAEEAGAAPLVEGATIGQARKTSGFYFLILIAGIFCFGASFFQQLPSYAATGPLGADAGAFAVTIVMIGGIVGKFLLGFLADTIGSKWTGIIACVAGVLGILLAFIAGSSVGLFYAGIGLFGLAYSALTVVAPMLAREGFGTLNYSQIYQWVTMGIFLFSAAAPLTYARIFDLTGSFSAAFILVMIFYAVGAVLMPLVVNSGRKAWAGQ